MREARISAEPTTEQRGGGREFPECQELDEKPSHILQKAGTSAVVFLCLATALVHVLLVFLHVAPPNPLSRQYSRQVNAWVFPLFEQNWRLFAPDPESVNRQISARTMHTAPDGSVRVSGWFDLTAVDHSAVEHNPFPSHTAQNTLRRAWSSYLDTHGGDDQPRSQRALMIQRYLTNIAADRITGHRGGTFESVQLRVITVPIALPAAVGGPGSAAAVPKPAETRYLPWWKVTSHGN
ncbi:hypothetical protein QFZ22_005006 [Streptomyces canus]|uniref:Uncharacterized protein n=1 Tax=Streptomyces canus TaxID=58343 RepID=A0AAW8FFU5_9ACTN|nr:DUF5819 family protein [Streptomyces canus]MDQ0909021.1 hypothetical protein [Streptomyces canus]